MDDKSIVQLYWERSEQAIAETDAKYGKYCYSIAYNALANNEDAEESVRKRNCKGTQKQYLQTPRTHSPGSLPSVPAAFAADSK